jgi:hypothetical protein
MDPWYGEGLKIADYSWVCSDGNHTWTHTEVLTVSPSSSPPEQPGTISGNTNVCQGQNSVLYTVPSITNATSYVWTLPPGATGTSTTNNIQVNYGNSAISGDITVLGQNGCGDGPSSSLAITVGAKPATPVITINGTMLHSDSPSGNQWYNQSGLIPGATNQTFNATSSGNYYDIVTLAGCSSDPSNIIIVYPTGITLTGNNKAVTVYPNPATNELFIEMEGANEKVNFEILNSSGQIVFEGTLIEKTVIQTTGFAPGIYLLKLGDGKTFEFIKVLKK